jgi:hypothetical protein
MSLLYSNENFPLPAVLELRKLGHDVLTTQNTGMAGRAIPDGDVLDFARREGRAIVTLNRKHFIRLHNQSSSHAGIIVCSITPTFCCWRKKSMRRFK